MTAGTPEVEGAAAKPARWSAFDEWLVRWPAGLRTGDLARVRILYASYMLLFNLPRWGWIDDLPGSWYSPPPGMMPLFPAPPPGWLLDVGTVTVAVLLSAVLVGYRTRFASVALSLVLLLGSGFAYSWGKINHDIFLVLLPLFLAPAGWGNALSLDARAGRTGPARRWPITLFAVAVSLAILSAAVPKLLSGWLSFSNEAVRGFLIRNIAVHGRDELLAEQAAALELGLLWPLTDIIAVTLEAALIVLLFRRGWFRTGLAALGVFHVAVLLTMNIAFTPNLISYSVFFVWPWVGTRDTRGRVPSWAVLAGALALALLAAGMRLTNDLSPGYALVKAMYLPETVVPVVLVLGLSGTLVGLDIRERLSESRRWAGGSLWPTRGASKSGTEAAHGVHALQDEES